jgi:uncharacterized membrane protein YhiD involved in acid resistance
MIRTLSTIFASIAVGLLIGGGLMQIAIWRASQLEPVVTQPVSCTTKVVPL